LTVTLVDDDDESQLAGEAEVSPKVATSAVAAEILIVATVYVAVQVVDIVGVILRLYRDNRQKAAAEMSLVQ